MIYSISDSPKMLRETLCVAQSRFGNSLLDEDRKMEHINRLQRLINECDRHRPLGPDGKHGNLHTLTCGCELSGLISGARENLETWRPGFSCYSCGSKETVWNRDGFIMYAHCNGCERNDWDED